jgi:hypothetical protein
MNDMIYEQKTPQDTIRLLEIVWQKLRNHPELLRSYRDFAPSNQLSTRFIPWSPPRNYLYAHPAHRWYGGPVLVSFIGKEGDVAGDALQILLQHYISDIPGIVVQWALLDWINTTFVSLILYWEDDLLQHLPSRWGDWGYLQWFWEGEWRFADGTTCNKPFPDTR